ncbi:hypothetical protein JOF48_002766 [Arthrobacter stackebrandtii]|uniref:Uncharacterized protein n=1 Tax=Arthrobacter stackebrandtii TaxID=272161 RepID=A0ABS4YZT1_9MICC|nr:hypothetical protein [Arthrobacter stackebrandtii]MBP2413967.1 hypothetical protein [Arthrobacter stackebrandtii]PYH00525.1 hypothetical protein CVV67_10565 [Arthrobacter stackebrandtii]
MTRNKRFSVWPIFTRHYRGMIPTGRRRLEFKTVLYLFIAPATIGAWAALGNVGFDKLEPAIAGLGVLAGAFLAGFVLLTDLRIKIRETESYRVHLGRLIGRTAASTMYLMVMSILTLMLIILGGVLTGSLPEDLLVVQHIIVGISVAALVHIVATGMTFLRRLFNVYVQLFSGDFAPELHIVDQDPTDGSAPRQRRAR